MKWTSEAAEAVSRAPFFVRKKIRKKVEDEARRTGSSVVTMEHVRSAQQRFFRSMDREIKGFRLEQCFGQGGCPNRIIQDTDLVSRLDRLLQEKDFLGFLRSKVDGPLKFHHEFRVTLADCPNACSRPQIVDIGIIGALRPRRDPSACTHCGACLDVCEEKAFSRSSGDGEAVLFDDRRCLACGHCLSICPADALSEAAKGYRILLGGKLGRHPQLARELSGIYSAESVLNIVDRCVTVYMEECGRYRRFGDYILSVGWENFLDRILF